VLDPVSDLNDLKVRILIRSKGLIWRSDPVLEQMPDLNDLKVRILIRSKSFRIHNTESRLF
jgi:hypothetical protein